MYLGYEEFMLCLTTKNITCYQCSLQQVHRVHRFPHSPVVKPLFKPFVFLNAISKLFSLRIAEGSRSLLKETCRFIVKVEPVEGPPFYQPPTVFSTEDLRNCLESHAFKNPPRPTPRPCQFSILAFPMSMIKLQSRCGKIYGFNIFCIPVGENTKNLFILHFNYALCPIEEQFVKGVERIFKHIRSKAIMISQFSWFLEPQTVRDQPSPTLFIKMVAETKFVVFFHRDNSSNFNNWDFKSQLAKISWNAQLPSHIDFNLVSKYFKQSFRMYREQCKQLAINQCICCLCQSSYPTGSPLSVYRCKPRWSLRRRRPELLE